MVRKVGLKPTPTQKKVLDNWFGCARATYNWALACLKAKPDKYKKTNRYWMRNRFINRENVPKDKLFLLSCPKQIRESALNELVQSYKTNFSVKNKNPEHRFDIRFRSKKDDQCISIEPQGINKFDKENSEVKIFPSFLKGRIKMNVKRNKLPDDISYECKILKSKDGKYSMVIVYHSVPENQRDREHGWCAIDPGVRTLYTVYSPSPDTAFQIGNKDIARIYRLCLWVDKLNKNKKKKKAESRLRRRIKNLVNEVHCKTVNFLVKTFDNIILPPFEVSKMTPRMSRKIGTKSVRQMLGWSHYALKQRLLQKAKRYSVNVYIRGEEYTSKTCTNCLKIKDNLKSAKVYKCSSCGMVLDRDLNGARNIFTKNAQ